MASRKEFIRELRRSRFGIGADDDGNGKPLAKMLQKTIKLLSAELYQKDIHFISELLQNAEDNTYHPKDTPSMEILLTDQDLTQTNAPATLVLFNNEVGFSEKNIEAVCSAGLSSKQGKRAEGFIGEKGIGFKSVFLVSKQPYIISNGFRIRFNEDPDNEAELGYIVPEWVDDPSDKAIKSIYGGASLPTTVIILPLRENKVSEVQEQLTKIPAETLLFLSKISKFRIQSFLSSPPTDISLSRKSRFEAAKGGNIKSSTVFLKEKKRGEAMSSASYYMFKEKFKVPESAKEEHRLDVEEWTITLAFPLEERITSSSSGDIFAFLPSGQRSGFPFLINSDFLLVSSREALKMNSPWNRGIFRCIPETFIHAFQLLLKGQAFDSDVVPSFGKLAGYKYVPLAVSNTMEDVRQEIISKMQREDVVLCSSRRNGISYCRPELARTVTTLFRKIVEAAPPPSLPSIVDSSLQQQRKYGDLLKKIGVRDMTSDEYARCLGDQRWLTTLSDEVYVSLLLFLVTDMKRHQNSFARMKFFKYLDSSGRLMTTSIENLRSFDHGIYWCSMGSSSWLSDWTRRFQRWISLKFFPQACEIELRRVSEEEGSVRGWLSEPPFGIRDLNASEFAMQVLEAVKITREEEFVILATQFFFDCHEHGHRHPKMQTILDNGGSIINHQRGSSQVLLPACAAKWPRLIPDSSWSSKVLKMSDKYMQTSSSTFERAKYLEFLSEEFGAVDIPSLEPVDEALQASLLIDDPSTCALLLRWIEKCSNSLPRCPKLIESIQRSAWVKTSHGYVLPTSAFLETKEMLKHLQPGDVPFIDLEEIAQYEEALEALGVVTSPDKGYAAGLEHLVALKAFPANQMNQAKLLRLYRYLSRSGTDQNIPKIWVPATTFNNRQPSWKNKKDCVIHDEDDLADDLKVVVLDKFYDKELLKFFHKKVGVLDRPSTESYENLWRSWTGDVPVEKCHKVWRRFVSSNQKPKTTALIPSVAASSREVRSTVKLLPPAEVIIPDNLEFEQIFSNISVAWYPASEDIDVDQLFKMYSSMGARKLSECVNVQGGGNLNSYLRISRDESIDAGFMSRLSQAVLGYLVGSKVGSKVRRSLVLPLLRTKMVVMDEVVTMEWNLKAMNVLHRARVWKMVVWNKDAGELAIVKGKRRGSATDFCDELATTVTEGVLGPEQTGLVAGMKDFLTILAFCSFSQEDIDKQLRKRNIRLSSEDLKVLEML